MEGRNKGLIIFGIILLVIGLVASFYSKTEFPSGGYIFRLTYPYQSIGILLDVAGIVFIALGFLYPSHRTLPPPPTNPQQQKTN
jgi:hypothetical protein